METTTGDREGRPVEGAAPHGARRYDPKSVIPMIALHLLPLGMLFTGVKLRDVAACLILYVARMFLIGAGLHRYLSHRAFKTSRVMQFLFVAGGNTAFQAGALWWAANHRHHHKHSDTPEDLHSPKSPRESLWWAHLGWILSGQHSETKHELIRDFLKFPELRALEKVNWLPGVLLGAVVLAVGGWSMFFFGFALSTVIVHHVAYSVNSLAHVWGSQRYATGDTSRNNGIIALFTLGEGWHNNHHHYQSSASQGFFWWEIDLTYYILKLMEKIGLVWDVRKPPPEALRE